MLIRRLAVSFFWGPFFFEICDESFIDGWMVGLVPFLLLSWGLGFAFAFVHSLFSDRG
jgi:hypothetical protein